MPPRFYPDENVRSTLSRDDVRRLLATTDGDRPGDTRDRAILMLLIVYGDRVPARGVRALRSTRLPAGRAGTFRLPRWAA